MKARYRVHYGRHLSFMDFSSWRTACEFMYLTINDGYSCRVERLDAN